MQIHKRTHAFIALLLVLLITVAMLPCFALAVSAQQATTSAALWDGSVAGAFNSGSGTQNNPYIIATPAQLAYFCRQVNAGNSYHEKYIRLICDVNLNGLSWTPVGNYKNRQDIRRFSGTFDGCGRTVYNLRIEAATNGTGFFGCLGLFATVKNLNIENGSIKAQSHYTGGIAGFSEGAVIENCHNAGVSVFGGAYTGGIVGYAYYKSVEPYKYDVNYTEITRCSSRADVSGGTSVGGIAGVSYNAAVKYCYNTGAIQASGDFAGGIAGNSFAGSVICCYSAGTLKTASGSSYTGAVLGYKESKPAIENCYYNKDACQTGAINGADIQNEGQGMSEQALKSAGTLELLNAASENSFIMDFGADCNTENGESINAGYHILQCQATAALTFEAWDGTAAETEWFDPAVSMHSIASPAQLAGLAKLVNDGNTMQGHSFYLTGNIDLGMQTASDGTVSGPQWKPIGTESAPFMGTFSGCGYAIKNMYVRQVGSTLLTCYDNIGLFGSIYNATIKNLELGGYMELYGHNLGSVAGNAAGESSVISVTSTATICLYNSSLFLSSKVGGMIGNAASVTLLNCTFSGEISSHLEYDPYDPKQDTDLRIGGIVGNISTSGAVANCTNTGSVLTYRNEGSSVHACGGRNIGGIAGSAANTSFSKCRNFGKVTGSYAAAGIAGSLSNGGSVTECTNTGQVLGAGNSIGGILGEANTKTAKIEQCANYGAIDSSYNNTFYVGGIAGSIAAGINACLNTGTVTGSRYSGGITGFINGGTVSNCYNTGTVRLPEDYVPDPYYTENVADSVCGLAGGVAAVDKNTIYLKNSFSVGTVDLQDCFYFYIAPIASMPAENVENCYYDGNLYTYQGSDVENNKEFQSEYVAQMDKKTRSNTQTMQSAAFAQTLNADGAYFAPYTGGTYNTKYPHLAWEEDGIDFVFDNTPYAEYAGNSFSSFATVLPMLTDGAQIELFQSAPVDLPITVKSGEHISFCANGSIILFRKSGGTSPLFLIENGGALSMYTKNKNSSFLLYGVGPGLETANTLVKNEGALTLGNGIKLCNASYSGAGSGIYNSGTLHFGGVVQVDPANDIYLANRTRIQVDKSVGSDFSSFISTDTLDSEVVYFDAAVTPVPSAFAPSAAGYALYLRGQSLHFGEVSLKVINGLEESYRKTENTSLSLTCSFERETFFSGTGVYQWYKDDVLLYSGNLEEKDFIQGVASTCLEFSNLTADDAGLYKLVLYDNDTLMSMQSTQVSVIQGFGVVMGDANGDRHISVADVLSIQKHIAGMHRLTGNAFAAADLDGGGRLTIEHVLQIQKYIAGCLKENPYKIGEVL